MDLIVIIVLMVLVMIFFRRFSSFVYFTAILDILFRLITFIKLELTKGVLFNFLSKYIPESIPSVLNHYSSGLLYLILLWGYIIIMFIFEGYVIRTFFRRK